MRAAWKILAVVLAGCAPGRGPDLPTPVWLRHSARPGELAPAFARLVHEPSSIAPALLGGVAEGYARGFPVAAVLVARGEADAVPLEVKVLHLALFEWPGAPETAILEP